MPEPFELDKEVEDFFSQAGSVHSTPEVPDPALAAPVPAAPEVPPTPAPAAPAVAAPPAPPAPVEDPSLAALRTQIGQLQQYGAQLERTLQTLQQPPAPPAEPPPNPETDPLGHVMHELGETKKMLAQLTERFVQQDTASAQSNDLRNFVDGVQGMTTQFMQTKADYGDAYQYLRNVRSQDMKDLGVPQAKIPEMLLKEELAVAARAIQQGMNPAQMVYNIATRYGYRPATPPPPPPAVKMDALQKGQAAAPTPVEPAATGPALTLDSVKDMTSDQLDKLVDSNDLWAKVVGGKPEGNSIFH